MNNLAFTYTNNTEYQIHYKPALSVQSLNQELINTAQLIGRSTQHPIVLAFSGGIDGEVIARSFLAAGIEFSALTLVYKHGLNKHDVHWAKKFCTENKIKHYLVELDLANFIQSGYQKYLDLGYQAHNVYRYLQLQLVDLIDAMGATAVTGGGEILIINHDDVAVMKQESSFVNVIEYSKNLKRMHFPYFLQFRPECVASYLDEKLIRFLLDNVQYFPKDTWASTEKIMIFHSYFTEMERRNKFHGFELVTKLRQDKQKELESLCPDVKYILKPISEILQELKRQ